MNSKKVAVIGLWHLGSTVAASLASVGHKVTGFDFDPHYQKKYRGSSAEALAKEDRISLIANLNKAIMPIEEAGLTELVKKGLAKKQLEFTQDFSKLKGKRYIVIGYDTPVGDDDKPDLTVIEKAVKQIEKYASANSTVIVMSQVPAGTSRKIYNQLKKKVKGVEVAYNPENLRLSQAIDTFLNADRQIIGLSSQAAEKRIKEFYAFYKNPMLFMSLESAEFVKHGVNSFLAMSVSFINQLSDLSENLGANISDVVKGMKSDSRIGQKAFLAPGLGFAGGTLGRDLRVLEGLAKNSKVSLPLISTIYKINQQRKEIFYKKFTKQLGKLKGKKIAMLGLVYKPGTNTLRRSLSLEIAKWLVKQGAIVNGFDPALKNPKSVLPVVLHTDAYRACAGADALVIITEWNDFKVLDYKKIAKLLKQKIIFDTKNILSKHNIESLGFKYFGTGIGKYEI